MSEVPRTLLDAYSRSGRAWAAGPDRIYERLAAAMLDGSGVSLDGRLVLDVGAGTGAASRALLERGATVRALDFAFGMLAYEHDTRSPAVVGDATRLPFPPETFDVVVGAFSYNHLEDPVLGLQEARRVLHSGGAVIASAYREHDSHPAKGATETALATFGWSTPPAYAAMQRDAMPQLATVERMDEAARAAGMIERSVQGRPVSFPELSPEDLVRWRLGMAHTAFFFGSLPPEEQAAVIADAVDRLRGAPPLERWMVVLVARS